MALSPNDIAKAAAAFQGFSEGQLLAAWVYVTQQLAGNTMTPNELAEASACFNCSDKGAMLAQIIYLLNQILEAQSP